MAQREATVVMMVELADLDRGHNIRSELGDLDGLAASIERVGVLTPVTIARAEVEADGAGAPGWVVVAGHRRVAAAERVGVTRIPALVTDFDSADRRLVATLVENLVREDLDVVDEARGFGALLEAGWSQGRVARRVGRSKGHVSKRVKLLALPEQLLQRVRAGEVKLDHAYQLARLAVRDTPPERLVALSKKGLFSTDTALREKLNEEELAARVAELAADGHRTAAVSSFHHDPDHIQVRDLGVDEGAHQAEPCHVTVVSRYYTQGHMVELEACDAPDRHEPEGESELKVPDQKTAEMQRRERDARWAAEREAAAEAKRVRDLEIATRLQELDGAELAETVIRMLAIQHLSRSNDDSLIPTSNTARRGHGNRYPARALTGVPAETLVVALARQLVVNALQEWWRGNNPAAAKMADDLVAKAGLQLEEE